MALSKSKDVASEEQCPAGPEPCVLSSFKLNLFKMLPATSPRDTPQLGDGVRSTEASGMFFDSIDTDGDGAIEPEEVARFLKN